MSLVIQIKTNKIYAPLKNKWLILTPEEKVRQEYITHLVNHYGFALEQMAQEVKVNNSKRGQGKAQADIVIWKSEQDKLATNSPIIVVECKAEHINVREEDYYQGYNYASWAGADFFITTNLKNTKFFRVVKGKMPLGLEEVIQIPKAEDLNNETKIQKLLAQTKAFTRDEFSRLLFKCHNIIRNNDKLSPEAAFDEISKILFMKIRYEREQAKTKALFSRKEFENLEESYIKIAGKNAKPFYQHFFDKTKEAFEKDEIFDPNDTIKVRGTSFLQIVKELEKYNLSDTSDDIKGIAFEEFLGKTFRGELGQFFTPRTIVDYMVDILDPEEGEIICDPCCGSGGFLIKAFEYVREKIENDIQQTKEQIKSTYYTDGFEFLNEKEQENIVEQVDELFAALNHELNLSNQKGRLRTLSYDCIFGTDANPRMARTAKMNMIMHGDGHGGVHHHDGLLDVNGIFDNRFDVILTNPPFGARVNKSLKITVADLPSDAKIEHYKKRYPEAYEEKSLAQIKNNINKPLLNLFEVGKMSGLTEVLFMERCINLLKPGGRMGIVLPEGVLNNSALQKVRTFVEGKAKLINITSIPQDVFIASGANVKPSVVFLKKFTEAESIEYQRILDDATEKAGVQFAEKYTTHDNEYDNQEAKLKAKKDKEGLKKVRRKRKNAKKQLDQQRNSFIRRTVKAAFDYPIPVIEVEKAGITSTGAKCENELEAVAEEFKAYRKANHLWDDFIEKVEYPVDADGNIFRVVGVGEPEIFYGK